MNGVESHEKVIAQYAALGRLAGRVRATSQTVRVTGGSYDIGSQPTLRLGGDAVSTVARELGWRETQRISVVHWRGHNVTWEADVDGVTVRVDAYVPAARPEAVSS